VQSLKLDNDLINSSDEKLVEMVLRHDREALGELFKRYQKPFFNLAFRFSGDYYQADDLVSEIFLRIYKYLKTFRKDAKFRFWALKIATNTCLTYSVKNSKLKIKKYDPKIQEEEQSESQEPEITDERVNVEKEVEKGEIAERVQEALQKLPEKYRLAIFLYYFEGLKYEEIAEDLELPVNTIRTHIKRGKEKMKEELRDLIINF